MSELVSTIDLDTLKYDERGLIPMVVQDIASGAVLMVGWADRSALQLTVEVGRAHFFSRSRQQLWRKGETSGNELVARELSVDCDRDTVLLLADPLGPTCHTGSRSCFESDGAQLAHQLELGWLARVVAERAADADAQASYTARLLKAGLARVAQKVGEEAVETVIAGMNDDEGELVEEGADLLFHLLVLLQAKGVGLDRIAETLRNRHQGDLAGAREATS